MADILQLQEIWKKYVQFMVDWATEGKVPDEVKKKFDEDPRAVLTDKDHYPYIGMTIPPGVTISIDKAGMGWPAVYVKVKGSPGGKQEWIALEQRQSILAILGFGNENPIKELLRGLRQKAYEMAERALEADESSVITGVERAYGVVCKQETEDVTKRQQSATNYLSIPVDFKDCEVGIRLPFLTLEDNMLGGVHFNDGQEITLSTCT